MDQWHVVSEERLFGVLFLTVREGRAHAYRTVPYYDEFTEQSVFKAVQRGNTDPRAYCMGCGGDEGALHEHWCHAVKEATCVSGQWRERPRAKKPVDQLPEDIAAVLRDKRQRDAENAVEEIAKRYATTHATGVNWDGTEAKSWWFRCARDGLTTTNSAGINECKCLGCGQMIQAPGVTFRAAVHPESPYIPGKDPNPAPPPPPPPSEGQRRELSQPCATLTAKAFHLRPPRREIVVLVDDMSEPP